MLGLRVIASRTVQGSVWIKFLSGKGQLLMMNSVQPLSMSNRLDDKVGRLQATSAVHPSNRPTSSNLTAHTRPPARIYATPVMLINTTKSLKITKQVGRLDGIRCGAVCSRPTSTSNLFLRVVGWTA